MFKISRVAMAAALAMAAAGAQAAPSIAVGESTIFFNNFENLYRTSADCAAVGGCLVANASDPAGYQRVDSTIAGNVRANDIFAGILNVQNIQSTVSGFDTYNSVAGDRFTGYFAQRVVSVDLTDPTQAFITLGTVSADPFGILAAGEMFRLYANMPNFTSGGTGAASLASAVGGAANFWGSLGLVSSGGNECGMLCGATDSYAYSLANLTLSAFDTNVEAFLALNLMATGPTYSAGTLGLLNDANESIVGGLNLTQPCSAAQIADPAYSCTNIVGTAEIEGNSAFTAGNSYWQLASNDPLDIDRQQVPEPGSLALLGLALAGLGVARRRQPAM